MIGSIVRFKPGTLAYGLEDHDLSGVLGEIKEYFPNKINGKFIYFIQPHDSQYDGEPIPSFSADEFELASDVVVRTRLVEHKHGCPICHTEERCDNPDCFDWKQYEQEHKGCREREQNKIEIEEQEIN